MSTSLNDLKQRRLNWIKANRENNFEDGIKQLLTKLYPDNAHFIYELLQNAEDTKATSVKFTLTNKAAEFMHNGERLFNLKDVESITSIGASTKRDDPTSIGKFGVGFKAVFAYTNTPEIHSGDFHFRIHDLVVPETSGVARSRANGTRFIFPFDHDAKRHVDHDAKRHAQAVKEVKNGLLVLGDNTLLFLSHIHTIEYGLPNNQCGSQKRIEHNDGHVEIWSSMPGDRKKTSHWLRFEKTVKVKDDDGKTKGCRIAIAYRLQADDDGKKKKPGWKIVPLDHGQVSIFFPAEKETSSLRFHIHAPFASTVARDSVRDCKANQQLRDHLAELVVESLEAIRDRGLLTVDFLATLPIPQDNLPEFYKPIREAIVAAFKKINLTPTRSGSHAPAGGLCRGPARIQEVIDDEALSLLTQYEVPLWAKNPPQDNQREARFLDSLDIEEWGWSELVSKLDVCSWDDDARVRVEEWVEAKDDSWLLRFYALLGEAQDEHEEVLSVSNLRIVRVDTGDGDTHVVAGDAYFLPGDDAETAPDGISFVKSSTYSSGRSEPKKRFAKSFLETAGVRPFDEKAVIERILAQYEADQFVPVRTHTKHIREFIRFWKQRPDDVDLFRKVPFLADSANDGTIEEIYPPSELCLDSPFEETGLADLYDIHDKSPVWSGYEAELGPKLVKDFVRFIKTVEVMDKLSVTEVSIDNNPARDELIADLRYRVRRTATAINSDWAIDDLEKYLEAQSCAASRLVWDALISADAKAASATYRPNQDYESRTKDSQLVYQLKHAAWIPDAIGEFRKPQDMTRSDLRADFPYDDRNNLLTAIGFGEAERQRSHEYRERSELARSQGFRDAAHMELALKATAGMPDEELQRMVREREGAAREEFPEKPSADPERRRAKMVERRENAPAKEKVQRERSIEPGLAGIKAVAKAYLKGAYTNDNGKLICQCCRDPMPFKLPSTEQDYFEAVQFIKGPEQRYYENYLALCPTCAAKYQHACTTEQDEIRRQFLDTKPDGKNPVDVEIEAAGFRAAIRFVATHSLDLKIILSGNDGV